MSKRYQLGRSPHLTSQVDEWEHYVVRSYETVLLVLNAKLEAVFTDTRIYSTTTTRHQRLLADYFPQQYVLPEKREHVSYEYRLKQAGSNANGALYSPQERVRDNPYNWWRDIGGVYDWATAYSMLEAHVKSNEYVNEHFVGTF